MASKLNQSTPQIWYELGNFEQPLIDDPVGAQFASDYDFSQPLQVSAIRFGLGPLVPPSAVDSGESYQSTVIDCLDRDPVLSKAGVLVHDNDFEVTFSMKKAIWITDEHNWNAWAHLFVVAQSILPGIPKRLAIEATPRGIGSPIGKTGGKVKQIRRGTPITKHDLAGLFISMAAMPFGQIMHVSCGETQMEPCPICQTDGSSLKADFEHGQCTGRCDRVSLARLYDFALSSQGVAPRVDPANTEPSLGTRLAARFELARQQVRSYCDCLYSSSF